MKYFDLHCDTITECLEKGENLSENNLHWSFGKAAGFSPCAQVFALWINDGFRGPAAVKRFDALYAEFTKQMETNSDRISFCKCGGDIKKAVESGRIAAILSIEGGAALGGNMDNLERAYEKGVRVMTLTWNGRCELGDGARVKYAHGLTPFGKETVARMQRLGMVADVSHLSKRAFWDVAEISSRPFIASHSDSKSVCSNARNLDDRQFKEISGRGGIVGLNFCRIFLRRNGKAYISDILKHIDHFLSIGGENTLALGGDLDGCSLPLDMSDLSQVKSLYAETVKRYTAKTADAIFFGNAYRFFSSSI